MMSRLNLISAAGFLFLAALNVCGAANFTASLDRDTVTLGESATLSLKFEGGSPQNPPSLPGISGLSIGYIGRQSIDLNINGVPSSIVTFTYALAPQKTGEFIMPSLTATVDGNQLVSQPQKLTLTVTQPHPPTAADINSGSQYAFMKMTLPKTNIYAGEVIAADIQIYLRQDVQLVRIPNYANPQITSLPVEGLTVGKISSGNVDQAQIGNTIYNVIPAKIALTAIKPGPLSIGPVTVGLVLDVPSENQPTRSFGGFAINFGGERKQISIATETINAEALPLPVNNVPANFNGAVGDYQLTATIGPTNLAVGDPVTVRVQISGRGALDALMLPDQTALRDFKIFPPTSKVEISDRLGLEGTKTFEEIVAPQNSDVRAWPQFSFSFFNPDDEKFHTLTQPAVPLAVHSAGATVMPTIAATKNSAPENQTPQDILPIKENLGTLAQIPVGRDSVEPLITRPFFLAIQAVPVLAFLAAFVWRKRADNLANNPRLRRQRAVAQLVNSGLSDLKKFAAENKSNEFFAMLFRLLQEQLGERLDCPATAITEADVDRRLIILGASPVTLELLRELFQLCNQARYAPIQTRQELASVAAKFKKVVGEFQSLKL